MIPVSATARHREIELKLELSAEDVERVRQHPRVRALASADERVEQLRSVYFDTPDLGLRRGGIALRVRHAGDARVQTLKTGEHASGVLSERGEYDTPLDRDAPDPARISDPALRARVASLLAGRSLEPIFETHMQRTTRPLREGDSVWTLDIDVGEIRTATARAPICEIELELVCGEAQRLYALALALGESIPLRLGCQSKADRGYALATGVQSAACPAVPVRLGGDTALEDAIGPALRSGLDHVAANLAPVLSGAGAGSVRQLRAGLARLGVGLASFADLLPAAEIEPLREALDALAAELDALRDLDVFAEVLHALPAGERAGLAWLERAAYALRDARCDALRQTLRAPRCTRCLLVLGSWLESEPWRRAPDRQRLREPVAQAGRSVLAQRHALAMHLGVPAAEGACGEARALRSALAVLRESCEVLRGAYPAQDALRFLQQLETIEDACGSLDDDARARSVLRALLDRHGACATPEQARSVARLTQWIGARAAQDALRLAEHGPRLAALVPFWEA